MFTQLTSRPAHHHLPPGVRMYEKPTVRDLGTFAALTLGDIHKDVGGFDTVHYSDGTTASIPGSNPSLS